MAATLPISPAFRAPAAPEDLAGAEVFVELPEEEDGS